MKSCPICNHTLPTPKPGNAEVCTFCGWKSRKSNSSTQKKKSHYRALSAEELAQKEYQDNPQSFRNIIIVGVIFFLAALVMIIRQLQPAPPNERIQLIQPTPQVTKMATPTPTPIPTLMPTPSMAPTPSNTPSFAAPEFTDTTPTPSPSGSGSNEASLAPNSPLASTSPSSELTPPPLPSPSDSGPSPSPSASS